MHILGEPFHTISLDFLRELARDRVPESVTHDHKRMVARREDTPGQGRFLEAASAFANTQGGVFVIGSTARRSEADGVFRASPTLRRRRRPS
jgi:hypothetical protein